MKEKLIVSLNPRAASMRRTERVRRWAGVSTGLATALRRATTEPNGTLFESVDAHDFFDQVGTAMHIAAPGRRRNLEDGAVLDAKAKPLQD